MTEDSNILSNNELRDFLELKYEQYNRPDFIESDPIQIPHLFRKQEDIEIAAFLTSTIAWGQRQSIINNARWLMKIMDDAPFDFVINSQPSDIKLFEQFVHRTFNFNDCFYFVQSLKNIYQNHRGLKNFFEETYSKTEKIAEVLIEFRKLFFSLPVDNQHVLKHISDVSKNSAAKRLNLFLMWMVRKDNRGVHFGLWNKIDSSALKIPLDVHVGNVAREISLLARKQADWQAVTELTDNLKQFDKNDPVKYDFALFGLGIFENWKKPVKKRLM